MKFPAQILIIINETFYKKYGLPTLHYERRKYLKRK